MLQVVTVLGIAAFLFVLVGLPRILDGAGVRLPPSFSSPVHPSLRNMSRAALAARNGIVTAIAALICLSSFPLLSSPLLLSPYDVTP